MHPNLCLPARKTSRPMYGNPPSYTWAGLPRYRMAGWEIFTGRVSSAVRGVPFCPGVGSPIVASCLARPLSAPPLAVSSLDVIAASPSHPCRCPWNASAWTEPARRPGSCVCPGPQFRKDCWLSQKPSFDRRLWAYKKFFRNWGPGADSQAGGWGRDEIRNITGNIGLTHAGSRNGTGALKPSGGSQVFDHWDGSYLSSNTSLGFDASLSIPTGPQNVPQHVWQPLVIYLGRSS